MSIHDGPDLCPACQEVTCECPGPSAVPCDCHRCSQTRDVEPPRHYRLDIRGKPLDSCPADCAQCQKLRDWARDEARAQTRESFLSWRGVETPCSRCDGAGVRVYADSSTWRRKPAGQALTTDVCDACWGTGDANRKGADLRRLDRARDEARAVALEEAAGVVRSMRHPIHGGILPQRNVEAAIRALKSKKEDGKQ